MKVTGIITAIIMAIVLIAVLVLSIYGLFAPVRISEKNIGPYLLVYKKHIGDYKNVGPLMDKLYYDLKDNHGITTTKGFGLYYDNPQEVDKEKLRSIVGCIVEGKAVKDLDKISNTYGVKEYPSAKSVVTEFPYKGKISIILGVFKVYPKLSAYIKEHKYAQTPIMEIYDQPNERIEYISSIELSNEVFDDFLKLNSAQDGKAN